MDIKPKKERKTLKKLWDIVDTLEARITTLEQKNNIKPPTKPNETKKFKYVAIKNDYI